MMLLIIFLLGAAAVSKAYRDEKFGRALVVGVVVATACFLVMDKDSSAMLQTVAPSALSATAVPAQPGGPTAVPAQPGGPTAVPAQPGGP